MEREEKALSREKNLVKNTFVLALGRFLPKLVSVVTLPIITGHLSKADFGTYDLITTMIMFLIPVATLQIQSAAFRFLIDYRGNQKKSSEIITNILVAVLLMTFLVSLIVFFVIPGLDMVNAALVSAYFFLDSLQNALSQITRGLGGNKVFSVSSILVSFLNGLGIVLFIMGMDLGLFGVIMSLVIANLCAVIYLMVRMKLKDYIRLATLSGTTLKELLAYSWPMVPNNLSSWVLKLSDRVVILAFIGVEANAVYAAANKVPNLLSVAQTVLLMAWQENASLAVNDKDASEYYTKMFYRIFSLMIGFTAVLIAFTPAMFKLLIRGDYDEAYIQMPILILGMFFYCMSAFQGGIYIAHKKTKNVGISTMIAALVNLAVDFALIGVIGITAGSVSTLTAYMVLYVYRMINCQKFQTMNFKVKRQLLLLSVIVVMLILCFLRVFWIDVINCVFGISFCFLLNRKNLRSLLHRKK